MIRCLRTLLFIFSIVFSVHSFGQVDHWEMVVGEGQPFQYISPISQLPADWMTLAYDDSFWNNGLSGIGYGDDDDQTIISPTMSVFLRKKFTITNISDIDIAILYMDFDDGFIAYLNGTEIGRSNMLGDLLDFDQASDGLHEALLHQGSSPEAFYFDMNLLQEGENILSVEVHNEQIGSSDLTANPFLVLGLNIPVQSYYPVPEWFSEPFIFVDSNLPIVTIDTYGQSILDDPKINAQLKIFYNENGERNSVDQPPHFNWTIGIETRGTSAQWYSPKKSYGIETWDALGNDIDTAFLNFPSEEDFILYGPYMDKSLINNVLIMKLGNDLGQYASRTRFVELLINGQYEGLYIMMEKIKRDKNRLDIAKLKPDEISGDDYTGGYIVKIDHRDNEGWISDYPALHNREDIFYQYIYPDASDMPIIQKQYIKEFITDFEDAVMSSNYINSKGNHYSMYIDLESFAETFIINELSKNVDGYRLSSYFYKDKDSRGTKLMAGPFWDFNFSLGNADYCGGDNTSGWVYYQCDATRYPAWWDRLLQDQEFQNVLRCRWEELRENKLSTPRIHEIVDSLTAVVSEAQERNFERWPILGTYVWPNPPYFADAQSHLDIINAMKSWIEARVEWMDANVPGIAENCQPLILQTQDNTNKSLGVEVYPNPAKASIHIRSKSPLISLTLVDLFGKKSRFEGDNKQLYILNTKTFHNGIYILRIETLEGSSTQKILFNN